MRKQQAIRLLNEALGNRRINAVGWTSVSDKALGNVLVPCLEMDHFVRVMLGFALTTGANPCGFVADLAAKHKRKLVKQVAMAPHDCGQKKAGVAITGHDGLLPLWNVEMVDEESDCELSKALLSSGLQCPCEVVNDAGCDGDKDDDGDGIVRSRKTKKKWQ